VIVKHVENDSPIGHEHLNELPFTHLNGKSKKMGLRNVVEDVAMIAWILTMQA
jgi:hypothetical protein